VNTSFTIDSGSDLPEAVLPSLRESLFPVGPETLYGEVPPGGDLPAPPLALAGLAEPRGEENGESLLFGYRISHRGLQGDLARACRFISSGIQTRFMACANPHSLIVARGDAAFSRALQDTDLLIPDGSGILLAARALNLPITDRVAGFEFFQGVTGRLAAAGGARYFFLGSSVQVLDLITERLRREHPEITVCGTLSPPFKSEFSPAENAEMLACIREARPDVLWVGMTAPKQEKWIHQNRGRLEVPLVAAIGAVFDFYAGTKQRPSRFWRRLGLEWLPRLLREPRRLWERNLRSTPLFLLWIVREKAKSLRAVPR